MKILDINEKQINIDNIDDELSVGNTLLNNKYIIIEISNDKKTITVDYTGYYYNQLKIQDNKNTITELKNKLNNPVYQIIKNEIELQIMNITTELSNLKKRKYLYNYKDCLKVMLTDEIVHYISDENITFSYYLSDNSINMMFTVEKEYFIQIAFKDIKRYDKCFIIEKGLK